MAPFIFLNPWFINPEGNLRYFPHSFVLSCTAHLQPSIINSEEGRRFLRFVYWDRICCVSVAFGCSGAQPVDQDWPWTCNGPRVSASWVLGLQVCPTMTWPIVAHGLCPLSPHGTYNFPSIFLKLTPFAPPSDSSTSSFCWILMPEHSLSKVWSSLPLSQGR